MSFFVTLRNATNRTITTNSPAATGPSPHPSPDCAGAFPIQSANDAPRGRVSTYAAQNASTVPVDSAPRLARVAIEYAAATIAITMPKMIPDVRYPQPKEFAVMSPAAVPRANVEMTVIQ